MPLDPQALALEVQGSLRLFGGIRALLRSVQGECPPATRTGLAPTASGACLLARRGRGRRHVVRPATLARQLDALPCTALDLSPKTLAGLQALGCHQLGHLRALPRIGLRNRGYAALIERLDQAYGQAGPQAPSWLDHDPYFQTRQTLDYHSSCAASLEAACMPLITALCAWLDARQGASDRVEIHLAHDHRRTDLPSTLVLLQTAQPVWFAERFKVLLREHLARRPLHAPVVSITLICARVLARSPRTAPLLLDDGPSPLREAALLDVLRARLGSECLHFPDPQAQHIPERTDRWRLEPCPSQDCLPELSPRSRPLWLLDPVIALPTPGGHHPVWNGAPLVLMAGPERIEGGWWVAGQAPIGRDYFIARDARGARYWVYREHHAGRWFLQGLFG
ncbi:MAG TPA: DNA polymerase Y family protein [Castellaniella sp.]|nr:DNA polymerase Y family protein [Castellaniella sp.]